jgi:hypothetical protein
MVQSQYRKYTFEYKINKNIHSKGLKLLNVQNDFWFESKFKHWNFANNGNYSKKLTWYTPWMDLNKNHLHEIVLWYQY